MMVPNPTPRRRLAPRLGTVVLCALVLLAGCKSKDGGGALQPAGGFTASGDSSAVPEDVARELAKFGWKPGSGGFERGNAGEYVFRARVPITGAGTLREYTEAGKTPTEAARKVLEH